jgi:hypothetical protein
MLLIGGDLDPACYNWLHLQLRRNTRSGTRNLKNPMNLTCGPVPFA